MAFVSTRSGDPQIFAINVDGSGLERLTFQGRYNQTPCWSPKGDVVAFTARDERNVFDIFTVDVKTKVIKRLTQDAGNNDHPTFSPNGRHIIFTSTRGGKTRLWMMNADGTNPRPRILGPRRSAGLGSWAALAAGFLLIGAAAGDELVAAGGSPRLLAVLVDGRGPVRDRPGRDAPPRAPL